MNVLNDLDIALNFLEPFLDQNTTFENLCRRIIAERDRVPLMLSVDTALNNLSRIRLWFNSVTGLSVEAIFPNVNGLVNGGRFVSSTRYYKEGESFIAIIREVQENKQEECREYSLKSDNLEDLIRGAIFCKTDRVADTESNIHEVIGKFLEIYHLSLQIHQLHLSLEEKGVPEFQGVKIEICPSDGSFVTVEFLQNLLKHREEQEKVWDETRTNCFKENPRLMYLTSQQLLQFMQTLQKICRGKISMNVFHVLPFVTVCFPEVGTVPGVKKTR